MNNYVYIIAGLPDFTPDWRQGDKSLEEYLCQVKELLSTKVVAGKTLVYPEVFLNLDLSCDTCVVGAGNPKGGIALHTLGTDKDILKGLVKGMTHMKLTGYVRRGDNYGIGGLFGIGIGLEISLLTPILINSVLKLTRVVVFC